MAKLRDLDPSGEYRRFGVENFKKGTGNETDVSLFVRKLLADQSRRDDEEKMRQEQINPISPEQITLILTQIIKDHKINDLLNYEELPGEHVMEILNLLLHDPHLTQRQKDVRLTFYPNQDRTLPYENDEPVTYDPLVLSNFIAEADRKYQEYLGDNNERTKKLYLKSLSAFTRNAMLRERIQRYLEEKNSPKMNEQTKDDTDEKKFNLLQAFKRLFGNSSTPRRINPIADPRSHN